MVIYCEQCKSNGTKNRCYITGKNPKCEHDEGWAYGSNKDGTSIMVCNNCNCSGNNCKALA